MLLLLLLVIGAAIAVYVYRKQIQIAIQERRLSNAVKEAEDAISGHKLDVAEAAQKVIADAKSIIARLKSELDAKK